MKLRPILFSAPMVRAILAGKKSQTRRVVKPQPEGMLGVSPWWKAESDPSAPNVVPVCPYGIPGDRLWAREAWRAHRAFDLAAPHELPHVDGLHYEADEKPRFWDYGKLRPSIHLPRWASRITLDITGVRVERLQEISEGDAEAEGVTTGGFSGGDNRDARRAFHALWESINGPGSWGANPWVWVLDIKRVEVQS